MALSDIPQDKLLTYRLAVANAYELARHSSEDLLFTANALKELQSEIDQALKDQEFDVEISLQSTAS